MKLNFQIPEIKDLIINPVRDREYISSIVTQHSSDFLSTKNRCRTYQHLPYPLLRRLRSLSLVCNAEHILIVSHNRDAIRCIQHVLIYHICQMIKNQGSRRSWFVFRNISSSGILLTRKTVFGMSQSCHPSVTFCDINDVMFCRQVASYLHRFSYIIWDCIDPYVDLLIGHLGTEHQRLLDVLGNVDLFVSKMQGISASGRRIINNQQVYNIYPCVFPEYHGERVENDEQLMNTVVPMVTSNQSSIASLMKMDLAATIGKLNWRCI